MPRVQSEIRADHPIASVPSHLRALAHRAGTGELLWPPEIASRVIAWMVDRAFGIIGVEAYGRLDQASASFYRDWRVTPGWMAAEIWNDYVSRAAAQAETAIENDARSAPHAAPHTPKDRRYFIAVTTEDTYRASMRA